MRISDWSSDVCSSDLIILPIVAMRHRDLFPFTDKDMSILALTARATRLVLSCRATTLQPLSVSTRLFRHHINLLCFRPMARPKRQEDPLLPVPLPRRRPSRANTRNPAASVKPELAAEKIGRAHV